MLLGALRSALSAKLRDGELRVVREFTLADHKTKNFSHVLATLEAKKTVLLVETEANENLARASSNLKGVKLVQNQAVTVYDLLKFQDVLLTESAARKLSEGLAK
jgi:large subunit ribosomal protein L4